VALEYLLSADTFAAEHLFRNRLVNHIADGPAELERIAGEVAARLAGLDPLAVKLTKDAHRMASAMPLSEAIVMGRQLNALLMASGRITAARDRLRGKS
jgi:enoyl-CoA hydratase/carnithine racemase